MKGFSFLTNLKLEPKRLFLVCSVLTLLLFAGPLPSWAHNWNPDPLSFSGVGPSVAQSDSHEDAADPSGVWAGWVNLMVTNTGHDSWGDFHFQIFQVPGQGAVDNVDWETAIHTPTSSQSGLTWTVDNDTVGAILNLYFHGDPVTPGETATFSVYNVNPDRVTFFGTSFYPTQFDPTAVPIPGAVLLFGSGLLGLLGFRKKLAR